MATLKKLPCPSKYQNKEAHPNPMPMASALNACMQSLGTPHAHNWQIQTHFLGGAPMTFLGGVRGGFWTGLDASPLTSASGRFRT